MVSLDNGNQYGEEVTLQTCPTCGKPIKQGKRKKKFCSERCQHLVNQRNRRSGYTYAQTVNSILLKNRNILQKLLPPGSKNIKIKRDLLVKKKFQFDYHTQIMPATKGNSYIYCYEYAYLEIEPDLFLIVKKADL